MRERDEAKWRELRAMTAEESLRIGEELWSSDLARIAHRPEKPRRVVLANLIRPHREQ